MRAWVVFASVALAASCGEESPEPRAAPANEAATDTAPAREEPEPPPPPEPGPLALSAIGHASIPEEPDRDALAANRRALALLQSGDDAASEAAFGAIVEAHPGFVLARFNHACALARLGQLDRARSILEALLAQDYPSIGPRLDADPDLAALREGEHAAALTALRARIEPAYRRALAEGMIVTRLSETKRPPPDELVVERRTVQVGVWLAAERRFVPMGPRITQVSARDAPSRTLAASALDRAHGLVLGFTGFGSGSEWGDFIDVTEVAVYRAASGDELSRVRRPCGARCVEPSLTPIEGGAVFRHATEEAPDRQQARRLAGQGEPAGEPLIACRQEGCRVRASVPVERGVHLRSGRRAEVAFDGEPVVFELDRAHAWHRTPAADPSDPSSTEVRPSAFLVRDGDGAWLVTEELITLPWASGVGASAISRVEPSGRAVLVMAGRGHARIERGPDGSLYLQVDGRVQRHAPGSTQSDELPAGLLIDAGSSDRIGPDVYEML